MLDLKNMKPKKDPFDTVWLPRNYSNFELSNFDTKYRAHQFKSETDFLKYVQAINNYGADRTACAIRHRNQYRS